MSIDRLSGLARLWQSQELCDYTLIAEGRSFQVHKAILASVSDYFYAMLTSAMKESQQNYVELKAINASMLQLLLDYVYTGVLHIREDNVSGLLNTAAHLQITSAMEACLSFLNTNISVDNCVERFDIASPHSYVSTRIEDFVANNLNVLIKSGNYLKLSYDSLKVLLGRKDLMFGPEEKLYQAVVRWLEHDPKNRMQFHIYLMELIRFPLFTANQIETIIEMHSELMLNPVLNNNLKEAQDYLSKPVHQRVLYQHDHTRLRVKPHMLTITDEGEGWFAHTMEIIPTWYNVNKVDFQEIHRPGYITVNDFLLTCGGALNYTRTQCADDVTGKCFIFDPREYKWTELASMCVPRQDVSLVEHKGFLYALGGSDGLSVTKEIERYSFETNQWEVFTTMYSGWKPFFGVTAACVVNDKIYTCDGSYSDAGATQNKMAILDILTKTWKMASMKQKHKAGYPMWFQGDLVYAAQGDNPKTPNPTISWYDPKTGNAGLVSCPQHIKRYVKNIFADKERLYFLHGDMGFKDNLWGTSDLIIKDKSIVGLNSGFPFPFCGGKERTKYFVKLRLPLDQFINRPDTPEK